MTAEMSTDSTRALLPAGLMDVLPPDAAHAAAIVERLLARFANHGYERVKPPLIEFEDSLLRGSATSLTNETFRLMDPVSQRMMGVRADITMQIARIATTRLVKAPRPLRLCYAGDVLRVKGAQLRPERQFTQIGFELIGAESASADVEAILLAAEALGAIGIKRLSVDVSAPKLVPAVCDAFGLDHSPGSQLRGALARKDAEAVAEAAGDHAAVFVALLAAAGPAKTAIPAIEALDLPDTATVEAERLVAVTRQIADANSGLACTIDPVEHDGFEYHTGIGFTFFAPRIRGELGSGGRYVADAEGTDAAEAAVGATLYLETILRALPAAARRDRVFVPVGTSAKRGAALREAGWVTIAALDSVDDPRTEARRLGCSHVLVKDKPVALADPAGGKSKEA